MASKLPPTVYGARYSDNGRKEDEFLHLDEEPENLLDDQSRRRVGVYKLVGYTEVRQEIIVGAIIQKAK